MNLFDNVGGRKFAFSVFIVLVNLGLILFHFIGEQNWVTIVLGVIAVYIGGNVAHQYVTKDTTETIDATSTKTKPVVTDSNTVEEVVDEQK